MQTTTLELHHGVFSQMTIPPEWENQHICLWGMRVSPPEAVHSLNMYIRTFIDIRFDSTTICVLESNLLSLFPNGVKLSAENVGRLSLRTSRDFKEEVTWIVDWMPIDEPPPPILYEVCSRLILRNFNKEIYCIDPTHGTPIYACSNHPIDPFRFSMNEEEETYDPDCALSYTFIDDKIVVITANGPGSRYFRLHYDDDDDSRTWSWLYVTEATLGDK
jgi:hypothetical protein